MANFDALTEEQREDRTHFYTVETRPALDGRLYLFDLWKGVYRIPDAHKLMRPLTKGFAASRELAKRQAWEYMKSQGATKENVAVRTLDV